jgi:hypothetical protein
MVLKQFVEQLSRKMGFEQALEMKEDGSYSLHVEPNIDIVLYDGQKHDIQFYSILADLPQKDMEDYLLKAMKANLFGRETGESALGLDGEGKKVVLVRFLAENESFNTFYEQLEEFVNYAECWRNETMGIEFDESNEQE